MSDYEQQAARYDEGRALEAAAMQVWVDAAAPHLREVRRCVDVGAGTCLFAVAFADAFPGLEVEAVEPSEAMRVVAASERPHPRVHLREGRAEHLPLRDRSADAAWLSTVIHHVHVALAAAELRRILVVGAPVLLRGVWPDSTDGVTLFRYFPAAAAVVHRSYPQFADVVATFARSGLRLVDRRSVTQVSAPSLGALAKKVETRADTTLQRISDTDYHAGLATMRARAEGQKEEPVVDRLDLAHFEAET